MARPEPSVSVGSNRARNQKPEELIEKLVAIGIATIRIATEASEFRHEAHDALCCGGSPLRRGEERG